MAALTARGADSVSRRGILRLFFADALPLDEQLALVRRLRERAQAGAAHIRAEILPQAEALERAESRYPLLAARFGADSYAYTARWLGRLEAQLDEELKQ